MVTCPRCAQQVDETTRTTCPNCFTPLATAGAVPPPSSLPGQNVSPAGMPGQPQPTVPYPTTQGIGAPPYPAQQPYPPQPMPGAMQPPAGGYPGMMPQAQHHPSNPPTMNPGARMSLTGEVVEQRANSGPPPNYVAGGAAQQPPMNGMARPTGAYGVARRVEQAPARSGGKTVAIVLVVLLLLGGVGAGGWWFLTQLSNPVTTAKIFCKATATEDWKTVYTVMNLPEEMKTQYPTPDSFATALTSNMQTIKGMPLIGDAVTATLSAYKDAKFGEATITDDTATVPVTLTVTLTMLGQSKTTTSTNPMKLKKVNGMWKVEPDPNMSRMMNSGGVQGLRQ